MGRPVLSVFPQREFLDVLQDFVLRVLITNSAVQRLEFKDQGMIVAVMEAMPTDPESLLPREDPAKFSGAYGAPLVIYNAAAAITDTHLLKTYERLFLTRMRTAFDRLDRARRDHRLSNAQL